MSSQLKNLNKVATTAAANVAEVAAQKNSRLNDKINKLKVKVAGFKTTESKQPKFNSLRDAMKAEIRASTAAMLMDFKSQVSELLYTVEAPALTMCCSSKPNSRPRSDPWSTPRSSLC